MAHKTNVPNWETRFSPRVTMISASPADSSNVYEADTR